jgi:hypothetical protein
VRTTCTRVIFMYVSLLRNCLKLKPPMYAYLDEAKASASSSSPC